MNVKRKDANQTPIEHGLRQLGISCFSLHIVGKGCPDLLVGAEMLVHGRLIPINLVFEIKVNDKAAEGLRKEIASNKTKDQVSIEANWHRLWKGQKAVVSSLEEIVTIVNKLKTGDF